MVVVDEDTADDTQNRDAYRGIPAEDSNEDADQDVEDEDDNEDADEEEDIQPQKYEQVFYPDDVSKDALIRRLTTTKVPITSLVCEFNDEANLDDTKDLQCTLLGHREHIKAFSCQNRHNDNKAMAKRCFDFFLEFLTKDPETPYMRDVQGEYLGFRSITLEEARKLTTTIELFDTKQSKNSSLTLGGDIFFSERGTFECIFNTILDSGNLEEFTVWTVQSIVDLEHGCIGRSNLATNTTLKWLWFQNYAGDEDFDDDFIKVTVVDDAVCELASALRQNTGLQSIELDGRMLTNVGRQALLDSLRDNCTLTALTTQSAISGNRSAACVGVCTCSPSCDSVSYEIQSEIDDHMKLNKCWTRIQNFPYMDMKTKKGVPKQMPKRIQTISVQIYPDVIEVLAKKPLLLYKFLRNDIDHTLLFGDVGKPPRRRRSARVRKKRRLIGPSSWHSILKSNILRK